jgi:hypothetical protein
VASSELAATDRPDPQMLTAKSVDTLLDDLRAAIDEIKAAPPDSGDLVALYGELARSPVSKDSSEPSLTASQALDKRASARCLSPNWPRCSSTRCT